MCWRGSDSWLGSWRSYFGVNEARFNGDLGSKPVSGLVGFKIKLRLLEEEGEKIDIGFGE